MALCALEGRTVIVASAAQTVFTIGWDALLVNDADVLLWFEDVSAGTPGAEATQGAGAGQFSVDRTAGTCTLVTAAEVNDIITIERHQSTPVRKTTFTNPGDLIPQSLNNEFDHFLQLIGDLSRDRCRSIRMDRGVDLTSLDLELPAPVSGSAIGWTDATTIGNIGVLLTGSGTLNTIPLWTPDGFTLGDSVMTQSGTVVTVAGTLTGQIASSGATAIANSGLIAEGAGTVFISILSTGIGGIKFGDVADNQVGSIAFLHASNTLEMAVSGASELELTAGATLVTGVLSAGSGVTVLTTAAGLLRHQAIDPAIAGAGITATSGVLSVTAGAIGSGTLNTIPLWTPDGTTLGDSALTQAAGNVAASGNLSAVGSVTSTVAGLFGTSGTAVGTTVLAFVTNGDDTNVASHAQFRAQTEDSTGGDPYSEWKIAVVNQSYTLGIDNSDSDKFVGSVGAALGTANWLEVTTARSIVLDAASGQTVVLSVNNVPIFTASGTAATVETDLVLGTSGVNKIWTKYVPVSDMALQVASPPAAAVYESGEAIIDVLDFDPTTSEFVGFTVDLGADYDGSALTFTAYWTFSGGAPGDVVWIFEAIMNANGETLGAAASSLSVTDSTATVNQLHVISGARVPDSASTGRLLYVRFRRNATDGADTFAADARLIGIGINY